MIQRDYEQVIKDLQEEILLLKEKYHILEEMTPSILFEYTKRDDKMVFFYNLPDNKEKQEVCQYQQFLNQTKRIHPDHIHEFLSVLNGACEKNKKGNIEYLSIISGSKEYEWHKAYYSSVADEKGNISGVMGRIQNTHHSSLEIKNIIRKVETDPLTGFYKKEAAVGRIDKWLQSNPTTDAYMAILDLTNLKKINEKYGHSYGDEILGEIAGIIRTCFSSNCIISRITGAEFFIFAMGGDIRLMECQVDVFMEMLVKNTSDASTALECNIGIAGRQERNDDFEDILNRAENAIYFAKQEGTNRYFIARE